MSRFDIYMSGVGGQVVVGTPAYLSPEAHNHQRANPSFDLWALAVTFYEVLTGRRPFQAASADGLTSAILEGRITPLEAHLPNCGREVCNFFADALAPNPTNRPESTQQLAKLLGALRGTP